MTEITLYTGLDKLRINSESLDRFLDILKVLTNDITVIDADHKSHYVYAKESFLRQAFDTLERQSKSLPVTCLQSDQT